jgi:hypothetical protein
VVGINAAVNDAHQDRLLHAKMNRPQLLIMTNACQLDRASSSAYIHGKNKDSQPQMDLSRELPDHGCYDISRHNMSCEVIMCT